MVSIGHDDPIHSSSICITGSSKPDTRSEARSA
jgi:hypothetical protein